MDETIQRLLGIAGDEKRIYRFVEGDVQREEFAYCQLLDRLVFGEKGYVETLGPAWDMIHDPRFSKIEGKFIVNRKAIFGGDASLGKQYMSDDKFFVSTMADLEEYSEILGEGRYFWLLVAHPCEACPERLWHERIYPEKLANEGKKAPPVGGIECICPPGGLILYPNDAVPEQIPEQILDPRKLKDASDGFLLALIKRECPNYFYRDGKPNLQANRLFSLFRADLVGLIADYSPTPQVDAYVELKTGDVLEENEYTKDPTEQVPRVFLEVDILEKALTYRACMRATAAKVLRQLGFQKYLKELGDPRLTDVEKDMLLRKVYESDWPDCRTSLVAELLGFLSYATSKPFEQREKEQLSMASREALDVCRKLKTGKAPLINQYTEPTVEVQTDQHAAVMEAILKNPLKQELFVMWAEAERRSGALGAEGVAPEFYKAPGEADADRLNMAKLFSMLTPIFTDPNFDLDDEQYWRYLEEAKKLGYYTKKRFSSVEGVFEGHDDEDDG